MYIPAELVVSRFDVEGPVTLREGEERGMCFKAEWTALFCGRPVKGVALSLRRLLETSN